MEKVTKFFKKSWDYLLTEYWLGLKLIYWVGLILVIGLASFYWFFMKPKRSKKW